MAKRIWLAWSSGKDSALAFYTLRQGGRWDGFEVCALICTVTEDYGRVSMHGVRRELVLAQAESIGMPLIEVPIPAKCTNEQYEEAMRLALERAINDGVVGVAFGDIHLADVREYRERQMAQLGMLPIFPLWGEETGEVAIKFLSLGFKAIVICVDSEQLNPNLCGREYDESFLGELPSSVDPCGENGEFHTFVYDGPIFVEPIEVRRGEIVMRDGRFAFCDLTMSG
ncbi:MAG: diphthine--ammonia ligase [Armatimonadota bacterium]|nr:diphthine--ammonia ligase [Armatimonadota bacterium]MCX7778252.1 diphthine--ammonia ligase [Armatimonadota bacterium]MDW8025490.1 diphthine--ammonia ligase [Armatimonadota bacterium]